MASARFILVFSCPDRPGIVHAITGILASIGANIEELQQFISPAATTDGKQARFFMRIDFSTDYSRTQLKELLSPAAERFSLDWKIADTQEKTRAIIMVSKEGHCLNDLLFRYQAKRLVTDFVAVVSNHQTLAPLAKFYDIPFYHVPISKNTKPAAEDKLRELIHHYHADLIILARYMQILSDDLCRELTGKAINIHHSFLPSFKGAKPYDQAFARGVKLIGATSHYIIANLDEGPIIEQEVIRVNHTHTPEKLVELGRDVEARTLSEAVRLHNEHRVIIDGNRTLVFK